MDEDEDGDGDEVGVDGGVKMGLLKHQTMEMLIFL